jgi:valyl-tRNA synthetase
MSSNLLEKSYEPHEVERRWYQYWEEQELFAAQEKSPQKGYSIVIPPPNVTGVFAVTDGCAETMCSGCRERIMPASPLKTWLKKN